MAVSRIADRLAHTDLGAMVERYIERISEASRHIPDDPEATEPGIDWRGIAAVGNVLRHAYDRIEAKRLWQIVTIDLASLKAAILAMQAALTRTI